MRKVETVIWLTALVVLLVFFAGLIRSVQHKKDVETCKKYYPKHTVVVRNNDNLACVVYINGTKVSYSIPRSKQL